MSNRYRYYTSLAIASLATTSLAKCSVLVLIADDRVDDAERQADLKGAGATGRFVGSGDGGTEVAEVSAGIDYARRRIAASTIR